MSSYALWRRALRRVERRAKLYRAARARSGHDGAVALQLLAEACRLANQLAPIAAPRLRSVR